MPSSARAIKQNRQKLTLSLPKPRNPLVAHAVLRKAGQHGKSSKAQRALDASALKKSLQNLTHSNA